MNYILLNNTFELYRFENIIEPTLWNLNLGADEDMRLRAQAKLMSLRVMSRAREETQLPFPFYCFIEDFRECLRKTEDD